MNPVLTKAAREGARLMANKAIKYLRAEFSRSYALLETFTADIEGAGCGKICADYKTRDGSFEVVRFDARRIRLVCHPFPAEANLWNGPDIIPDDDYAAMAASLVHDLIWGHSAELAQAWGVSPNRVLAWGNDVLYAIWNSASGGKPGAMARLAYHVCNLAAPLYHKAKKLLRLGATACLAIALCGCSAPPDWVAVLSGTNAIHRAMADGYITISTESGGADAHGARGPSQVASGNAAADSVDFSALQWCWGGFNGAGAQAVDGCRIAGLSVQSHGMAYRWQEGGCEMLGASSRTDAACIAALFVRDAAGNWKGGKFDWISTSRTTRDFANIETCYGGWPTTAILNASAYAFVIVSEDGRRRSNVIVQEVHR